LDKTVQYPLYLIDLFIKFYKISHFHPFLMLMANRTGKKSQEISIYHLNIF